MTGNRRASHQRLCLEDAAVGAPFGTRFGSAWARQRPALLCAECLGDAGLAGCVSERPMRR